MRVVIEIQKEAVPILQRMAKEAGIGLHDICEIGIYNLVALFLAENADPIPMDTPQPVDITG